MDSSPLPFKSRARGAKRFAAFCRAYVVVPKGTGARRPLHLRPWQVELVGSVATTGLYEAVVNGTLTHSGDPRLARHVANATVRTDNRGTRITKEHKHSTRRIDLAVCAIMAHSVAVAAEPGLQLYWYEDAS